MNRPPLNLKSRRRGFTLIELLVVIIIIATLIALLIPAIASAVRAARNASVQAEINQIAQALADFKSKYGEYPPSRIILNENGGIQTGLLAVNSGAFDPLKSTATDITLTQLANRTQNAMRKFWPRAQFTLGSNVWGPTGAWYDFNGNGSRDFNQSVILQGHECLVFFLGGIPLVANNGGNVQISVIGFGKDPVNPFTNGIVGNGMYSANRNNPFFQFDSSRLAVTDSSEYPTGYATAFGPTFNPGYFDSLPSQGSQNFYAYFSTNNGSGYDPNDVNLQSILDVDGSVPATHLALRFCAPLTVPVQIATPQQTFSPVPNPYTTTSPIPSLGTTNTNQSPTFINAQSYQIISAGSDGAYGTGGIYAATSAGTSPELNPAQNSLSNTTDTGIRVLERDNLTNFHNGKLE